MTETLRLGSLFAGIGGFDLGFERAGFRTSWAVEIDKHAQAVLRLRFPGAELHSDVREVGSRNLGPVDVVTFGSPCQDLSVAGKRAGLAGGRSGLFHEAVRVIRELREAYGKPDLAMWENVPGAFSSNGGRDFEAVLRSLADLGALDVGWRVLDSRFFGVPQRRKRIVLVADFTGRRAGEVLALEEGVRGHLEAIEAKVAKATGGAREGVASGRFVGALLANRGDRWGRTEIDGGHLIPTFVQDVADPLVTGEQKTYTHEGSFGFRTRNVQAFSVPGDGGVAPTLTASNNPSRSPQSSEVTDQVAAVHSALAIVRRLTPVECCRLQGFPDAWNEHGIDAAGEHYAMSDAARYRQLGNAVTVNVAEYLARRIVPLLQEAEQPQAHAGEHEPVREHDGASSHHGVVAGVAAAGSECSPGACEALASSGFGASPMSCGATSCAAS